MIYLFEFLYVTEHYEFITHQVKVEIDYLFLGLALATPILYLAGLSSFEEMLSG